MALKEEVKTDTMSIRYDHGKELHVLYMNDVPMMKNKKASTLAKKLAKWLQSQGR